MQALYVMSILLYQVQSFVLVPRENKLCARKALSEERWIDEMSAAMVDKGICNKEESVESARLMMKAAPGVHKSVSVDEATSILHEHLRCDQARRRRHDAILRLIASSMRGKGRRVHIDTPLYQLPDSQVRRGKSRRVDIALEVSGKLQAFVEVTVLAKPKRLASAKQAKLLKYRDLSLEPLVVAVHAISGTIYDQELTEQALASLLSSDIDEKSSNALLLGIRETLIALTVEPLLDLTKKRRDFPLHLESLLPPHRANKRAALHSSRGLTRRRKLMKKIKQQRTSTLNCTDDGDSPMHAQFAHSTLNQNKQIIYTSSRPST